MPTYDVKCAACGMSFDRQLPSEQRDVGLDCPRCGRPDKVRRVISGAPLVRGRQRRASKPGRPARPKLARAVTQHDQAPGSLSLTELVEGYGPPALVLPSHLQGRGEVESFTSVGMGVGIAAFGGEHEIENAHIVGANLGIYMGDAKAKIDNADIR